MSTTNEVILEMDHDSERDLFVALTQKEAPISWLWGFRGGVGIEQARSLAGRDIRFARILSFIPGRRVSLR